MFHFQNLRHNTETQKTDLLYSPHHIGQYSSVKLHEARPLVLLYPTRGNTGREHQDTRDLVKLQQTPNLWWIVHGGLQYATAIVTSPKQAAHRVEQTRAKKELTDSGRSEKKCRKRKQEPKVLQVAGTPVPRQKAIGCCARENAASKSHLLGGGKRSQLIETPHFSFLPSLAASCVGPIFC